MQHMAIVECVSSGRLYVNEIISRGYRPLIVNVITTDPYLLNYREMIRRSIGDKADYIDECGDFDRFVEELKKYDIVAAFAGSEYGVRLADRIVKALGLRGNDADTTYLRCNKGGMYEALGKAGIRRIEGMKVRSEDDIRRFWKDNDLDRCVMKYAESAATVGLKICSSPEEAIEHYRVMLESVTGFGTKSTDILIQEYIGGTEYIVDTLSCDGKHMITDIWVYAKIRSEDGTLAYDYAKLIKDLEPGHTDMVQYVYKVLDAVDMKWGISHNEIKIDRKGPVLIEVNARPLGLAMTPEYLDEALGYHLTDMAIDVYLDPSRFDRLMRRPYNPPKYAMMKLMIVPEDIVGTFAPTFAFSNMIRSTREVLFFGKDKISRYSRTIDLDTSPLVIKMINSDYGELMKDYEVLRTAESRYFHLLYSLGEKLRPVEPRTDTGRILEYFDSGKKIVLVTDGGRFSCQYGERRPASDSEIYDGAVYAVCGEMTAEERYRSIFWTMHNIRSGGPFIAVPESYEAMKQGTVLMDFLMDICGVRIMVPAYDFRGVIYGVKR